MAHREFHRYGERYFPPATKPQTYSAAALGITFNYSFGATPNSLTSHASYEVQLPVLVIKSNDVTSGNNDGAYFDAPPYCPGTSNDGTNPASGYCNAFATPEPGFSASVLGGASIGIAPYAAPLCTTATCPASGSPTTTFFGFCATFATTPGVPAVETFLQIGTDGRTAITTPVGAQGIQCPS